MNARQFSVVWFLLLGLLAQGALAASVSSSAEPPEVNGWDQAVLGSSSVTDKWWVGGAGWSAAAMMGQTFTTGDKPVQLSAITFRICESCKAEPTKVYGIRLGSVADKAFTLLHQETAEQSEPFVTGGYVTWRLEKPIPLHPRTKYGVDVDMLSSTSGWQSGIPYLQRFPVDKHPGGEAYAPGGEGNTTVRLVGGDRVFHLDLEASDGSTAPPLPVVPQPKGSTPTPPAAAGAKRVAIVGDGLAADPELAATLQMRLGTRHAVRGFGVEGATVLTATERPWSKQPAARELMAFAPQIVIVHFGAADTRPPNRVKLDNWAKDFQDLIISLMQIRGAEAIWLCIPHLTAADIASGANVAVFSDQLEVPLRLASVETGASVVDLSKAPEGLPGQLTPAQTAAWRLAESVFGLKVDPTRFAADPSPTPPPAPAPSPAAKPATPASPPAPPPAKPAAAAEPIRVACVGDELDAGLATAAEMGKLLGKTHEVRSFQSADTRLLNTDKLPYHKSGKLAEARAYKPHVVVITLAEKPGEEPSFKEITAFDREMRLILNDLLAWSPRPLILLSSPVPYHNPQAKPAPAAKNPPRKDDKRKSNTLPIVERARAAFRLLPADPAAILRNEKLMPKDGKGNPLPAQGYARQLAEAVQAADGP